MFRMIGISIVAAAALAGVIGIVFAVGALRIHLADDGTPPTPAPPPANQHQAAPAPQIPLDPDPPKDPVPPPSIDSIALRAEQATLDQGLVLETDPMRFFHLGRRHRNQVGWPDEPPPIRQAIVGWRESGQTAQWSADIPKTDYYEIDLVYTSVTATPGVGYVLKVGDQELKGQPDGSPTSREAYKVATVGSLRLPAGKIKLQFHLEMDKPHTLQMRVREIRLVPAS